MLHQKRARLGLGGSGLGRGEGFARSPSTPHTPRPSRLQNRARQVTGNSVFWRFTQYRSKTTVLAILIFSCAARPLAPYLAHTLHQAHLLLAMGRFDRKERRLVQRASQNGMCRFCVWIPSTSRLGLAATPSRDTRTPGSEFERHRSKSHPNLAVRWASRELFNMGALEPRVIATALIEYVITGRSVSTPILPVGRRARYSHFQIGPETGIVRTITRSLSLRLDARAAMKCQICLRETWAGR